jgi:pantoate kinase
MDALSGHREDALIGEEELFNGAIGCGMATERGVSVELRSVKGGDAALSLLAVSDW